MTDYAALMRMLEELDGKATPGPWEHIDHNWSASGIYANGQPLGTFTIDQETATEADEYKSSNEAALSVALRNAVPALLDALAIAAAVDACDVPPTNKAGLLLCAQEIRKEKGK